jgi:hypothetical protein
MYEQIRKEIASDSFYGNNFPNEGQQFVAWYLRRVLLLDVHATRAAITDGQLDKQIDAIVVEDGDDRRVRVIQGKFTKPSQVDAAPVREVLSAWERLRDLPSLQVECSGRLAERLETMRLALEEDYEVQFELLATGSLTPAALTDVDAFKKLMSESTELSAGLTVVDSDLIETRLSEAEQKDLPGAECLHSARPESVHRVHRSWCKSRDCDAAGGAMPEASGDSGPKALQTKRPSKSWTRE